MNVAQQPSGWTQPDQVRVRELLRRYGRTRDRAERAALLATAARELDRAADEGITEGADRVPSRYRAADLRGQATMARYIAELERHDLAREAARPS